MVVLRPPQHIFVGRGDEYALVGKVEGANDRQPSAPLPNPPPEVVPRVPKPRTNKPSAAAGERGEEDGKRKIMKESAFDSLLVAPPPKGASAVPRLPKPYPKVNGNLHQTPSNPAVPLASSNPGAPVVPPRLGRAKMCVHACVACMHVLCNVLCNGVHKKGPNEISKFQWVGKVL